MHTVTLRETFTPNRIRPLACVLVACLGSLFFTGHAHPQEAPPPSRDAAAVPPRIELSQVLNGLTSPVYVTNARDGSNRLFVVEQNGRIRVLQPESSTPTLFLDIASKVLAGGERGLLGLAFHPQFKQNRRFFVNYTRQPDGATVIAEYRVSASDQNVAETNETVLLLIAQPFPNHNGGMIEFGPDHFLYIGMGDGGSANDPGNRAQNPHELLGKMLRIDVDHPAGSQLYSSPSSNPFFGSSAGREEVFALGLRNPWRFSFDRSTGQLYVADVGQNAWEEIDIVTLGGNYGWRIFEGRHCTNLGPDPCTGGGFLPPIAEYFHTAGRCAIIGGYVYRGAKSSLPIGAYVYGDSCTGEIFLLEGGVQKLLLDTDLSLSSFGEDEAGELYVVGLGGTVHRVIHSDVPTAELTLSLDATVLHPGATLGIGLTATNPGPAFIADFYLGAVFPDGRTVVLIAGLSPPSFVTTTLDADARAFQPLLVNASISTGFNAAIANLFSYVFSGQEPHGTYTVFAASSLPGAFNDGRVDPGDIQVIDTKSFTFSP